MASTARPRVYARFSRERAWATVSATRSIIAPRKLVAITSPCARPGPLATQPIGVGLPKLPTPLADSFAGHSDAAFEQEFLHVAIAQGEAIVEPDAMADDLAGKAVIFVALRVSRWCYVWLPIGGSGGS